MEDSYVHLAPTFNCQVLWNSSTSRQFSIKQGVRQGAILSPLLYSIYVDELLHKLTASGLGISMSGVYCGAPMYADDLALISDSAAELQLMLNIVDSYSSYWRYSINARKSAILVFGESPNSRAHCRPRRYWSINNATIPEADKQHHLGVLRTVYPTSVQRTVERCSAGRGAFFALNVVGTRFGCLHPLTSLRLYSTFCLPVMLYGYELWVPSKSEFLMLEWVHRKILRTIQDLPIRCSSLALQILVGSPSVSSIIFQRQLAFLHSFSAMSPNSPVNALKAIIPPP